MFTDLFYSHSFKTYTWICLCFSLPLLQSVLQAFLCYFFTAISLLCHRFEFLHSSLCLSNVFSVTIYIHPLVLKKNHTTGKIFTLKNNKHWHSISVAPFSTLVMRMLDNRFLQMNINHSTRIRGSSQRNGTQFIIVEDNERRRAKQLPQLIFLRMLFRLPSLIISVFGDFQIFRISENNFFYLYYKPPSSFRKIFH